MHSSLEMIVRLTSWRVAEGEPPKEVSPHPVAVTTSPVKREETDSGRQMGAALVESLMGTSKVRMAKS